VRRREFVRPAVASTAIAPIDAAAQSNPPTIGYFSNRSAEAETPVLSAFLDELQKSGFVVGRNVAIEYRFSDGDRDRLQTLATELVGRQVAVLVAIEHGAVEGTEAQT